MCLNLKDLQLFPPAFLAAVLSTFFPTAFIKAVMYTQTSLCAEKIDRFTKSQTTAHVESISERELLDSKKAVSSTIDVSQFQNQ